MAKRLTAEEIISKYKNNRKSRVSRTVALDGKSFPDELRKKMERFSLLLKAVKRLEEKVNGYRSELANQLINKFWSLWEQYRKQTYIVGSLGFTFSVRAKDADEWPDGVPYKEEVVIKLNVKREDLPKLVKILEEYPAEIKVIRKAELEDVVRARAKELVTISYSAK